MDSSVAHGKRYGGCRRAACLVSALFLLGPGGARAQAPWFTEPATAEHSFTDGAEGPVCDAGGNLFVCEFRRAGTIGKLTPDGHASVFTTVPAGGRVCGLQMDRHGYLLAADYLNHAIYRVDPRSGEFLESLARDWMGPQFREPNDIAVAADETVYFSDPDFQSPTGGRIFAIQQSPRRRTVLLDEGLNTPNGIAVSPDQKRLYISQSYAHNILVYDRQADGTVRNRRVFYDFASVKGEAAGLPDGIRCDQQGSLYVAVVGIGRVVILHPDGTRDPMSIQTMGKNPTNLTFCGAGQRTIYITESQHGRVEKATVGKGAGQ